jgi:streptomycin 6-kinase
VSLARRQCRLLAGSTVVSEAAIGEWGFLERVFSGLSIWSLGAADLAGPFLDTAQMPMLPTSARRP